MEVYPLGVMLQQMAKLKPEDSDLIVQSFDSGCLLQVKLLSFIKYLRIEAVFTGVLTSGGSSSFSFHWHQFLL